MSSSENNRCCPVLISLASNANVITVTILNDSCYSIARNMRVAVGPVEIHSVAIESVEVRDADGNIVVTNPAPSASTLTYRPFETCDEQRGGDEVLIRFNDCLLAKHTLIVALSGNFGNPVRACIDCFTPEVCTGGARCNDMVSRFRQRLLSTPQGIGCHCKICATVCHCAYYAFANDDESQTSVLYRLDESAEGNVETGPFRFVASLTTGFVTGAAIDPTTGIMYAVTGNNVNAADNGKLFQINASTGAAVLVGSSGFMLIPSIAFDSFGDLYGWAKTRVVADDTNTLVQFNLQTGAATTIGIANANGISNDVAIGFDAENQLFVKNRPNIAQPLLVSTIQMSPFNAKVILPPSESTLSAPPTPNFLNSLVFSCASVGEFYGILVQTGEGADSTTSFVQKYSASMSNNPPPPTRSVTTTGPMMALLPGDIMSPLGFVSVLIC